MNQRPIGIGPELRATINEGLALEDAAERHAVRLAAAVALAEAADAYFATPAPGLLVGGWEALDAYLAKRDVLEAALANYRALTA